MYFSTTVLALLAATSSALVMRRPEWLSIADPSELDVAFMTASKEIRSVYPLKHSQDGSYCYTRTNIQMDAGALPPVTPGLTLYHIALGRGTQNYTCPADAPPTAAPQALGAVATLYNITCLKTPQNQTVYKNLYTRIAATSQPLPANPFESGHHYFTNGNSTATFNLHTNYLTGNLGISYSNKVANVTAPADAAKGPDGSAAVPWLKLATIGDTPKPPTSPTNVNAQVKIQQADMVGGVKEIYRLNTAGGAAPKTCEGLVGQTFQKQYAAEYWFMH